MPAQPLISFVVAMDRNRLIGAQGDLPWRLPDDMKQFREVTMGKPVLMGRVTYESIPDRFRPLRGRTNIVVTHQEDYTADGCFVAHSLQEALKAAGGAAEVMVIGGAEIFEQLLPQADRIYLTQVHGAFEGDVFFPELDMSQWQEVSRQEHERDERHSVPFTFLLLERRP